MNRPHRRHIGVELPGDEAVPDRSLGRETLVFVMRPVIVAPGEFRSHTKHGPLFLPAEQRPSHNGQIAALNQEDLPLKPHTVAGERPDRPGVGGELDTMFIPGRMDGARIEICGQWNDLTVDREPFFKVIDQHKPFTRRFASGQ